MIYPTVKLGEIAKVSAGNSAPQDENLFKNGKYPFYRTADVGKVHYSRNLVEVKDYLNEEGIKGLKLYKKGTILFPKSGASTFLNHRVIMGQDGYVVSHLATISVNKDVDENFVYYYLTTVDAKDLCAEQGYPSLKSSNIAEVEIPLPPLETQKAIVAKLDQIFAELDQTKSEIQKNLDNTDEFWKSALNQAFQGDGEMKKLGEMCEFVRGPFGGSLKKEIFVKEGYAVYEQQHAIYNQFSDFRYFVNEEKFLEMKRFEVYPGDLIMSCSGTMGKVSIVPENSPKGIINQALLKITPSKSINAEFLKNWMDSKDFQDQIGANTQGAAIQNVASVKVISTLNIPVPPLSEQEKIVEHLDQVSKEVKALKSQYQSQLDNLEELKKSVLDKAFRGEMGE